MNATISSTSPTARQKSELQAQVVRKLAAHLPAHSLLYQAEDTTPYECDGLTAYRQRPLVVALPESQTQVAAVLRTCHAMGVRWWHAVQAPDCRVEPCRTPWV